MLLVICCTEPSRSDYIEDDDDVLEALDLGYMVNRRFSDFCFREDLMARGLQGRDLRQSRTALYEGLPSPGAGPHLRRRFFRKNRWSSRPLLDTD